MLATYLGALLLDPAAALHVLHEQRRAAGAGRFLDLLAGWSARVFANWMVSGTASRRAVQVAFRRRLLMVQWETPIGFATCDYCKLAVRDPSWHIRHACASFYKRFAVAVAQWHDGHATRHLASATEGLCLWRRLQSNGVVGVSWETDGLPVTLATLGVPFSLISQSGLWAQTEPMHLPTRVLAASRAALTDPFLHLLAPDSEPVSWDDLATRLALAPPPRPCAVHPTEVKVVRSAVVLPLLQSVALAFVLRALPAWTLTSALQPSEFLPTQERTGQRPAPTAVVCSLGLPLCEQLAFVHHYLQPSQLVVLCDQQVAPLVQDRMPYFWRPAIEQFPWALLLTGSSELDVGRLER